MSSSPTCAKCGSDRMILDAQLLEQGDAGITHQVKAGVAEAPNAWVLKRLIRTGLNAHICGSCGYAEVYAEDPERLWKAYETAKASEKE